jgi:hypothetical protein
VVAVVAVVVVGVAVVQEGFVLLFLLLAEGALLNLLLPCLKALHTQ